MEGLTENLRKINSNLAAARVQMKAEEEAIGKLKEELRTERSKPEPDQNKIKHLKTEVNESEKSYFAKDGSSSSLHLTQTLRIR